MRDVTVRYSACNFLLHASTTVTGPVGERLQDAPVLDRPAPLRRLHDSGTS